MDNGQIENNTNAWEDITPEAIPPTHTVAAFLFVEDKVITVAGPKVWIKEGSSWRGISTGIPTDESLGSISGPIQYLNTTYVFCGGRQLYRSVYPSMTTWEKQPGNMYPVSTLFSNHSYLFVGNCDGIQNLPAVPSIWVMTEANGNGIVPSGYPAISPDAVPRQIASVAGHFVAASFDIGVYVSHDWGSTFKPAGLRNLNLNSITLMHHSVRGYFIFAATETGVHRGTFGSTDWKALTGPHYYSPAIAVVADGNRLFGAWDDYGVFYSDDCGDTWISLTDGLPKRFSVRRLATNGRYLFASGFERSTWKPRVFQLETSFLPSIKNISKL